MLHMQHFRFASTLFQKRIDDMARTAPAITGAATGVLISWRYIDANATKNSFSLKTTVALATPALIEAVSAAVGAASNANLYEVQVASYWADTPDPVAAVDESRPSVYDNIVELFKDLSTGAAQDAYIPAPIDALFNTGTQDVDLDSAEFIAFSNAVNALLPTAYIPVSVRFTERRKTYQKKSV
jgi:hypothetical protein